MANTKTNQFGDGFPNSPLEAVEFSYFLSDTEKQEWREWIQTATPEQQNELVDILHSMWVDNQKSAVPDSFAQNSPSTSTTQSTTDTPTPTKTEEKEAPKFNTESTFSKDAGFRSFSDNQALSGASPAFNPAPSNPQPEPILSPTPDFNSFTNNTTPSTSQPEPSSDNSISPFITNPTTPALQAPTPNPFTAQPASANLTPPKSSAAPSLQSSQPTLPKEKVDMDALVNDNMDYQPNPLLSGGSQSSVNNSGQAKKPASPAFLNTSNSDQNFSMGNVRQTRAKQDLQEIYQELNQSVQSQQKYTEMLQKISNVLTSYDQVAEYFENIMGKVLSLNDSVRKIAVEQTNIKSTVSASGIQDQINLLRSDLDRLARDFRNEKNKTQKEFTEVKSQLSGIGVDVFGPDGGTKQKLELISHDIQRLKEEINLGNSKNTKSQPENNSKNNQDASKKDNPFSGF
jgi:hypothetical protein